MNILVIDVGTSSIRGILYRGNGEKVFVKQVKYQPVHGDDGRVEQPASDFEDALILILQAFTSRIHIFKAEIDAISITAQRSSVIPLDVSGQPLMDTIMWQDTRNREICRLLETYDDEIFRLSGARVNCVFSGGKMMWIRLVRPEIYKDVFKFVNIPEYLIHLMTGEYVTDHTYGSRSNLMNLRTREWDDRLLELFQVNKEHLCTLKEPGSVVGHISEDFSRRSGLRVGIPVISAGGDQQCAAIGHGAYKEGTISIVTGTGAFLVAASRNIPENLSGDIICNCSSVSEEYIIEANVLTCSSAFDWYCRTFYDWEKIDYARINQELEEIYYEESSCLVLPYFQGRSTPNWNPEAKAAFLDMTLGTRREEILKAVLEGIFLEISNNIHIFRKYVDVDSAYISGGLTNSEIMNDMQADIYGIPLYHLEDTESTSVGALIVALKKLTGKSIDEVFADIRRRDAIEKYDFDDERHHVYLEKQKRMNELYSRLYAHGNSFAVPQDLDGSVS